MVQAFRNSTQNVQSRRWARTILPSLFRQGLLTNLGTVILSGLLHVHLQIEVRTERVSLLSRVR